MARLLNFLLVFLGGTVRARLSLQIEVAALRHPLSLYKRARQQPRITAVDRLLWWLLARLWDDWRRALHVVRPRSIIVWQQKRSRDWRELSRPAWPGRPRTSPELRRLIERMIGIIRRAQLNQVIVLNERHPKRLLSGYFDYHHQWRTRRLLGMDAPHGRAVQVADSSEVIEFPAVNGLHHYHFPRAA